MNTYGIRHTFPNGGILGDGFVHSGDTYPQPVAPFYGDDEAQDAARAMRAANPGHTFEVVPYPA